MTLSFRLDEGKLYFFKHTNYLYTLDMDEFEHAFEKLAQTSLVTTEKSTDSHIFGSITTYESNKTIMTTIPYDEGWKLYVDGEPVEYTKALGALIAFEIEGSGEHTVRLKYAPKTFTLGLTISILSTALFVLIIIIEKPLTVVLSKIFSSNEAAEKEQDTEDDELANSENENDNVE